MKDIGLPEFGTPDKFIDLSDVVKLHAKQDSLWTEELAKMTDARPGQVQQFTEPPIRARTMLQQLNSSLVKYRACSGHQGNICGSDGTTQVSMGPNL
jgi:hypothetical protein